MIFEFHYFQITRKYEYKIDVSGVIKNDRFRYRLDEKTIDKSTFYCAV